MATIFVKFFGYCIVLMLFFLLFASNMSSLENGEKRIYPVTFTICPT